MIKRIFTKHNNNFLFNQLCAFSTAHHAQIPKNLPKVDEKIIWINVKNVYGNYERVAGFVGESFMTALLRSKVEGHQAQCKGGDFVYKPHLRPVDPFSFGPGCNTCQVIFKNPWAQQVVNQTGAPTFQEQRLLDSFVNQNPNSRLACCVPIESWMNNITLEVVANDDLDS